VFFFQFLSVAPKTGDQPQEDLAKSGYKTNKEIENLRIVLNVGKPQEPIR
jgi:hypothetical protein